MINLVVSQITLIVINRIVYVKNPVKKILLAYLISFHGDNALKGFIFLNKNTVDINTLIRLLD